MTVQDPTTETLSTDERDALVTIGRRIVADILDLTDRLTEVKRRLRDGVPVGTSVEVDGVKFAVQSNRRFDLERAVALLPDETARKACEVWTRTVNYDALRAAYGDRADDFVTSDVAYDARKVKALLSPAIVDSVCMVDAGEHKVVGL